MNKTDNSFLAEKIRSKYTEKEYTELDELKALDQKVRRPANIIAYVIGIIGAIIMGMGMSLIMTDIGSSIGIENTIIPGLVIGAVGLILSLVNYPLYKSNLNSRKKKYAQEILSLSDRIITK